MLNETLDIIRDGFEAMSRHDIVIAPWLTVNATKEHINESQRQQLHTFASELSLLYSNGKMLWKTDEEVPQFYREHMYYETILSTAAYLSYMRLGTLVVTDEMIHVSYPLVKEYARDDEGSVLLSVYARVMAYLDLQLLHYYDGVDEATFVSGKWHRPWIERSLDRELELGLQQGLMLREQHIGRTVIKLTDRGRVLYEECRRDLEVCGYLKQREQLMRAANFTNLDDYEPLMEKMMADVHEARKHVIDKSGVRSGMHVLELGCGAGALTFDDGLHRVVGDQGEVIATDPSLGMLQRAKQKRERVSATNVELRQAAAESLPFQDDTFDAVLGFAFLHFTNIPKAFKEIRRVTRSGGTFTTSFSLNFSTNQDFFVEWFKPLFERGLGASSANVMPEEDSVPRIAGEYFESFAYETVETLLDVSDVSNTVRLIVQAGAMAELDELPWHARNELFEELIERGQYVKERYGADQMKLAQRGQWFHGVVKK